MTKYGKVDLNLGGPCIWQDTGSLCVSHASHALQLAALELVDNKPLGVLDMGTGCGIVAIMLALQRPAWQVEGLEIQTQLHELAENNSKLSGASITFHQADLRSFQTPEPYGLIVSNPPWQKAGSGRLSPSQARNTSRFEISATMEDVLACVRRNLASEGDALLLYPEERVKDLLMLAPKTFLDIISLLPTKGLKKHFICHLRHKGHIQ